MEGLGRNNNGHPSEWARSTTDGLIAASFLLGRGIHPFINSSNHSFNQSAYYEQPSMGQIMCSMLEILYLIIHLSGL